MFYRTLAKTSNVMMADNTANILQKSGYQRVK